MEYSTDIPWFQFIIFHSELHQNVTSKFISFFHPSIWISYWSPVFIYKCHKLEHRPCKDLFQAVFVERYQCPIYIIKLYHHLPWANWHKTPPEEPENLLNPLTGQYLTTKRKSTIANKNLNTSLNRQKAEPVALFIWSICSYSQLGIWAIAKWPFRFLPEGVAY